MNDDILVKVENVSKKFCRTLKRSLWYGVKDVLSEFTGHQREHEELRSGEFWAVNNVSFELKRGECLGLIGHNGAGKTTLLRMLNGLIKPDHGRIEMRGRVGALIALGAGFNPILTGRENIYVNASVLGLTKRETDEKLDKIIDFAEIGEFIDSPVQSYSSGMQVRLGFSIASSLNPDILLLDEVLAVGDASFRAKCYRRISKCIKTSAVIFVSHNMEQVARICDFGCILDRGEMKHFGGINSAIDIYDEMADKKNVDVGGRFSKTYSPLKQVFCEKYDYAIKQGENIELNFHLNSETNIDKVWIRVVLFNTNGRFSADADIKSTLLHIIKGKSIMTVQLHNIRLQRGGYKLGVNIFSEKGEILYWSYKEINLNIVCQNHVGNADYQLEGFVEVMS